ncbi:MAG: SCO family protein [Mesonia hippocampi]|uniref:SCO family protein n=1 Tax=Mesonia hippocampi TaxID=1628250 RepID=UPI003F94D74E
MKRKYSYIGLTIVILVFGVLFIPKIVDTLAHDKVVKADRLNRSQADSEELAYIEIHGEPKKVPSFELVNQHKDTISNKTYLGKVYVVEFFFTTCPTICPIMNKNMVAIQKEINNTENFGIASFSINADHDTPEVLKAYAEKYGVSNPNWHMLTGNQSEILELANKGFNLYAAYSENAPGNFEHSGYFALVDQEGFIRSRRDQFGNPVIFYNGLEEDDLTLLKEDIKKLLKNG